MTPTMLTTTTLHPALPLIGPPMTGSPTTHLPMAGATLPGVPSTGVAPRPPGGARSIAGLLPPRVDDATAAPGDAEPTIYKAPQGSIPSVTGQLPRISTDAALRLGHRQARADMITSAPLFIVDAAGAAFAAVLAHAAGLSLGQPPAAAFIAGVVCMTVLFQHIHGLYPACGLTYSIEFRRIIRTCLMVTIGVGFGFAIQPATPFNWPALIVLAPALTLVLSALRPVARHVLADQN